MPTPQEIFIHSQTPVIQAMRDLSRQLNDMTSRAQSLQAAGFIAEARAASHLHESITIHYDSLFAEYFSTNRLNGSHFTQQALAACKNTRASLQACPGWARLLENTAKAISQFNLVKQATH